MGDLAVRPATENRAAYLQNLIKDVQALERMIKEDRFEKGHQRIGAEQELCMVDAARHPSSLAFSLLPDLPKDFTFEIGQFNLEANLSPFELNGSALQKTEAQLRYLLAQLKEVAAPQGIQHILTGILPTIKRHHLDLEHMTPLQRFDVLNQGLTQLRGGAFEINIHGADELTTSMPSVMYEAANTSWQLHLQLDPRSFSEAYNWAQYIAAPVLAVTANSPLLFGRELWHETRIALFQQSIDTRRSANQIRDRHNRVNFGRGWLDDSPVQLFQDNITRFPLILTGDIQEDALATLDAGGTPQLKALRLHNGTIYSWNRPCYGVGDDEQAHLRLENRYIPAGPTVKDQMANFAFWIGLMKGMPPRYLNLHESVPFQHAKSNFYRAARSSLHASLGWNGKHRPVRRIILEELLPLAAEGLQKSGFSDEQSRYYLSTIERRVSAYANGACWTIKNFRNIAERFGAGVAVREVTDAMIQGQEADIPIHDWPDIDAGQVYVVKKEATTIGRVMKTDLYTLHEQEPIGLAKAIMEWKEVRHLPIEDDHGNLKGLVTRTNIEAAASRDDHDPVSDIMTKTLITVSQQTPLEEAAQLMKQHKIGCMPIVREEQIIGLLTDSDFRELFGNQW
ncbi:MAG: CBS domain-containing protein [Phaeodactylibacter sp.]|uniref:CBS domain-containing protein n=1 Tax=Phaeodactylibacter sp. TaxID=1940289 RepID=UPI0032EA9D77